MTGYGFFWRLLAPTVVTGLSTYERRPFGVPVRADVATLSILGPHDALGEVAAQWAIVDRSTGEVRGIRQHTATPFDPKFAPSSMYETPESYAERRAGKAAA